MNGILAAVVLSLASANAAPTPQDFYSQAYHTHSLYPSYNIQYQSLPLYPYSNYQPLFPQPVYVQQPQPVSPLCLNSSEVKKIEADFQAAAEKIKNENERNKESTTKLDQNIDVKSVDTATHQDVVGKTSSGVDCINDSVPLKGNHFSSVPSFPQNSADPIFGPEVGAKYEVHYSSGGSQPPALPYFSSYSAYSAPPAFPAYPDFSVYSAYPVFGGSNPFAGFGSGGFELTPSNGNRIEGVPTSSPPPPGSEISTVDSIKAGDVSNPLIVKSDEISTEPSTTVTNETSSEFDFIGSPPSIDGPGKLSKKKRGQRKNDKKNA